MNYHFTPHTAGIVPHAFVGILNIGTDCQRTISANRFHLLDLNLELVRSVEVMESFLHTDRHALFTFADPGAETIQGS